MNGKRLSSSTHLTEAEPFLKEFAGRSLKNKTLVGAVGVDIDVSDFLALRHIDEDEYVLEGEHALTAPSSRNARLFPWYSSRFICSVPVCFVPERE